MAKHKKQPLEEGIKSALRALDNQIAREMQRTPESRSEQGVRKWEPYRKRIENLTAFLLNELGDQEVGLDSLLVASQSFAKTLRMVAEDLGQEGLGHVRSEYCREALKEISEDCHKGLALLRDDEDFLM